MNVAVHRLPAAAWLRLHQRLMPDYNRRAALYWWTFVLAGAVLLAASLNQIAAMPAASWVRIAIGTALAMAAGLVPVRIPRSNNSFTAGEIFIFLLLLLDGTAAAALASTCEAAVGSWRSSRRWTSRIASPAMAAVAMTVAGSLFHAALGAMQRAGIARDGLLLVAAMGFALAYFLLNTMLVSIVPLLKRREPLDMRAFFGAFGWLGVAYAGNASVATFLFLSIRQSGMAVVLAGVPIIVILLTTGHYFFRREEAEEAVRDAREQQAAQRRLLDDARQAGMAEIATNVLHNVGNVLNSVNVSADLVAARVRDSRAAEVPRVVQLLEQHRPDLGNWLTNDPRGRLLPTYLSQLCAALDEERREMAAELDGLMRCVRHIKEIVATQQSYAGASSRVEPVKVHELIEDALRISPLAGAGVQIVRRFEPLPPLMLDKHRVLLILVNLIGNALQAMQRMPGTDHRLTLRAGTRGGTGLRIVVADTGDGIAPENLTRIFAHGFTTRKEGHGFGLHSCVMAAQEMGGSIEASSDGPGLGASFTLVLPAQNPDEP
jgi:signal transduction histidine kinase